MSTRIDSLHRALDLVAEQPVDRFDFTAIELQRSPPPDAAEITAAETALGGPLSAEHRTLLNTYGAFSIREKHDIARCDFLAPAALLSARDGLHAFLVDRATWPGGLDALGERLVATPRASLFVAATDLDRDDHTRWVFYIRGERGLYEWTKKDPPDAFGTSTLEARLISLVCSYVGFDERRGRWYSR